MKKQLVLLPGWAMHSAMWGDFATQLSQQYTLTLIEHLPSHDTLDEVGDSIMAMLHDEPFYLLGWSLGGNVALNLAQRYSARVQGVILLASNPCFVANDIWMGMPLVMFRAFAQQIQIDANATLQRFLAVQCQGIVRGDEQLEKLNARFASKEAMSLNDLMQGLSLLENDDLRDTLANLTCPIMAILSDSDRLVPVEIGQAMQVLQPNLQLHLIEGAGHIPFLVDTQGCVNIVRAFIDGIREN